MRATASALYNHTLPVFSATIVAAQKNTAREWAAKAASVQLVMWACIAMMISLSRPRPRASLD
jgi:hypothetical protein